MATDEPTRELDAFFRSGITGEDLPGLFLLRRAWPMLKAFITLFRGGEEEVVVRLLVLREIGARADTPRWTLQQLRTHFAYLDEVKFETVLPGCARTTSCSGTARSVTIRSARRAVWRSPRLRRC